MKQDNRTEKRKLGDIGENITCDYLKRHGFEILDRNYLRKWGELDIVAKKKNIKDVNHVTSGYRPEDNVHPQKLKRLSRAIQTYILERRLDNMDWQLDIAIVRIDQTNRKARVEILENIII
jgi:putative endonuclease